MEPKDRHVAEIQEPMETALENYQDSIYESYLYISGSLSVSVSVSIYVCLSPTVSPFVYLFISLFLYLSRHIFFNLSSCRMGTMTLIPDGSGTLHQSQSVVPRLATLASHVKSLECKISGPTPDL